MMGGNIMAASLDAGGRIRRTGTVSVPKASTWHQNLGRELPENQDVIMRGAMEKKVLVPEIEWYERMIVVTNEIVAIGHVGENKMIDSIPLVEIVDVQIVKHDSSSPIGGRKCSTANAKQARGRRKSVADSNVAALPRRRASVASTGGRGRISSVESGMSMGDSDDKFEFVIKTEPDGYNSGRPYFLRVAMDEQRTHWVACLKTAIKEAKLRSVEEGHQNPVERLRRFLRKRFEAHSTQTVIALIIAINFGANVYAAELLPDSGSEEEFIFEVIEYVCTSIFVLEILCNLFVHWWSEFFHRRLELL